MGHLGSRSHIWGPLHDDATSSSTRMDSTPIATAVEVSAPGLLELWHFCRAATGLEGAALDIVNVMSHFNSEDESTLLALRDTLGAMDPTMSR